MTSVNLYDVLDVPQDCDKKEIKTAYRKLAQLHHPDKGGDSEVFELIVQAYDILSNDKKRSDYDAEYASSAERSISGHSYMKAQATTYFSAQEIHCTDDKKAEAEKLFKIAYSDMDRQHNYDRAGPSSLEKKEAIRRSEDLKLTREQEDIENTQDPLFIDNTFNPGKFNMAFDKLHKGITDLTVRTGNPEPHNSGALQYSSIDSSQLYCDDLVESNTMFGSVKNMGSKRNKKLTVDQVSKLDEAAYTSNYNKVDDDYERTLEEAMNEWKRESSQYDTRSVQDYNKNDMGGYGIFDKIGTIDNCELLEDRGQGQGQDRDQDLYQNDDLAKRYAKLLEKRNSTIG